MTNPEMAKKPKKENPWRKLQKEIKRKVIVDGKMQRRSFYGGTPEEAEQSYQRFINPEAPPLQPISFEGSFGWYYIHKYWPLKGNRRPKSKEDITYTATHLLPELGDMDARKIGAVEIVCALNTIAAKRTCRNRNALPTFKTTTIEGVRYGQEVQPVPLLKPISARTVNKCRAMALEIMAIAHEIDSTVKLPNADRIEIRDECAPKVKVYSPQELRLLLNASEGTQWRPMVILFGFVGVCLGEALALDATDLTADGFLRVNKGEDGPDLKTKYRFRDIPLPLGIIEELRPLSFGQGPLCKNTEGHRIYRSNVDRGLQMVMRRAGLRILTLHQFRHSFSSWMDEHGCPTSVRMGIMGQSTKQVKDRYNHPTDQAMRLWLGNMWEASFAPILTLDPLPVVSHLRQQEGT